MFTAGLFFLALTPVAAEPVYAVRPYAGWEEAVWLRQDGFELVFVPEVGRVMRFGAERGVNLLWEERALLGKPFTRASADDPWQNFGGDKLWAAPQEAWGWPPPPATDGPPAAFNWNAAEGQLEITGMNCPELQVRLDRTIRFGSRPGEVVFENTLTNIGAEPATWSVWQITQVDNPDWVRLSVSPSSRFPQGFVALSNERAVIGRYATFERDFVTLLRSRRESYKVGSDAHAAWADAKMGRWRLRLDAGPARPGDYPDEGSTVTVYSSSDPSRYMELEVMSPLVELGPGESIRLTSRWNARRL